MPNVVPVKTSVAPSEPVTVVVTVAPTGLAVVEEQPDQVPVHEENEPLHPLEYELSKAKANLPASSPRSPRVAVDARCFGAPRAEATRTATTATATRSTPATVRGPGTVT